jgi:hypothetical protein
MTVLSRVETVRRFSIKLSRHPKMPEKA